MTKKEIEIKKYVSSEFKNRLEMIWEDMIDDQEFGRWFHSKFGLYYDDCVHEGLINNLSWEKQLVELEESLKKFEQD